MREEEILRKVLRESCGQETTAAISWYPVNPFKGHCDLVALVINELLGGEIVKGILYHSRGEEVEHYWNKLSRKRERDFTSERYKGDPMAGIIKEGFVDLERFRHYHERTKRYQLYRSKAMEHQLISSLNFSKLRS